MIGRLSSMYARSKRCVFEHTALRLGWYLLVLLALLAFWACSDGAEIAFVYNAF